MTLTIEVNGVRMLAEFDYRPFRPGRISGPPESCYPDEPEEIEVVTLSIMGVDITPLMDNFEVYRVEAAIKEQLDRMQEEFDPQAGD